MAKEEEPDEQLFRIDVLTNFGVLTDEKELKGNLNKMVALINSFEEMILGKHPEIVQEMKVKAAKILFSNVEYEMIMDQMVKEPKNKISLIKAREIIVIGLKSI